MPMANATITVIVDDNYHDDDNDDDDDVSKSHEVNFEFTENKSFSHDLRTNLELAAELFMSAKITSFS